MDDLLREIKKLTANGVKSDPTSSNEETTSQPTSAKKTAKKRQKNRNKKHRGRKRRLKYVPDVEADSSSFTDCTDEDIVRDFVENITADLSDSDVESGLKRGAFLVNRDLSIDSYHMPCPEVDETDSYSESFRLTQSRKKRKRYKRLSLDSPDHQMVHVNEKQRNNIHKVLSMQYSGSSFGTVPLKKQKMKIPANDDEVENFYDDMMDTVHTQDSSQANSSSDNSDSSSNSPGSEADDEGEESCVETINSIKPVIPWWEQDNSMEIAEENGRAYNKLLPPFVLLQNRTGFKSRFMKSNVPVICESGGFVAYTNHKIRNFVAHRDSNELSICTANKKEQHQVKHLALLYNLQCSLEEAGRSSKVVLTKTLTTSEANQTALKMFLSREIKLRCRKNHPRPQWNSKRRKVTGSLPGDSGSNEMMDVPLPDSNVGNQILRTMGWKPGQGLGKDNSGITNPIKPLKRPRNLGFGHPGVT